jgi:Transposase DDE domain
MNEDWPVLLSFFPDNWLELANAHNVSKRLRKDKDVEDYIRTLLIHVGCGYSLRETVARAKQAGLADISDVALLGRLLKAKDWLHSLCLAMIEKQGIELQTKNDLRIRLFDATNVKEPGKTGSLWRICYSVELPSLSCDYFKLTPTKGKGTGESFFQYHIRKGDYIIADRGYSTAAGIHHVAAKGAHAMVRVNTKNLPLLDSRGNDFQLHEKVAAVTRTGVVKTWRVQVPGRGGQVVAGRLCVIRKTAQAISIALKKLNREAKKRRRKFLPQTYEYAKYVIVFTTFPEDDFPDSEVLEWYRRRWQIELVFKRFKSIAGVGHLPKHGDDSSKAWLYGKLFVALLTERLIEYAENVSPWGYELENGEDAELLARV